MSKNKLQLSKDTKAANAQKHNGLDSELQRVLKSRLGYSDKSPFREEEYIDIHTPNGIIDMSETGIPLFANGVLLPPYSGKHQFDTNVVREVPAIQEGGEIMELDDDEIEHYKKMGYQVEEVEDEETMNYFEELLAKKLLDV